MFSEKFAMSSGGSIPANDIGDAPPRCADARRVLGG